MKTAEELLKEKGITTETANHNYAYVYRAVCEVIGEAQKEAYSQALEDAALKECLKLLHHLNTIQFINYPLIYLQ